MVNDFKIVPWNLPHSGASNRMMKRLLLIVAALILAGCARPGDYPVTANCEWTEADGHSLDLAKSSDRDHLRFDAITAEDVAIRWADKYFGHLPQYEQRRDQCMATLFQGVAKRHDVDVAVVRQYSSARDPLVDAAVILSFGALYIVAAYIFTGRIRRRFQPDEPGFWAMTLVMALGVSLVGVMIANLWSIVIEGVRLNSGHLSYRMARLPWRRHWDVLFVCGVGVFALATLIRARVHPRRERRA
jgi:hypothetical protein